MPSNFAILCHNWKARLTKQKIQVRDALPGKKKKKKEKKI